LRSTEPAARAIAPREMTTLHATSLVGLGLRAAALPAAAAAAGWIAYSHLGIDHAVDLPPALAAEHRRFAAAAGDLAYYVDRSAAGRPLVLLHSINAAASAYEVRPLFEHYRGHRPVFALDLPGFGTSSRARASYSPELYREAIVDLLRTQVQGPADVVALSLTAEFAALAAHSHPELFHSLVVLSPTGVGERRPAGATPAALRRLRALGRDLWRQPLFDLITTRPSLRYFLGQHITGDFPEDLARYAFLSAHRPGAATAPLHFLSGLLFTPRIADEVYAQLRVPTLALYDEDPNVGFERLPDLLDKNPAWRAMRIVPTRGLPHWDKLPETVAALDAFWNGVAATAA